MAFSVNKTGTVIQICFAIIFQLYPVCFACSYISISDYQSTQLSRNQENSYDKHSECWIIRVPEHTYVSVELDDLRFNKACTRTYLKITEAVTNETRMFCGRSYDRLMFKALNDLTITYQHDGTGDWYTKSSFKFQFSKESIICTREDHFRCSRHQCIPKHQVCDRKDDCENALDEKNCKRGIVSAEGASATQMLAIQWLMEKSVAYGWEKNTHRAITALYVAQIDKEAEEAKSEKQLKKELEVRQLELKTLVALLRNSSEQISISELSMYVNALLVTCHNPRQFHGHNLINILYERASLTKTPCPGAYLTLCNADWKLSASEVTYLLELLKKNPDYSFLMDIQAMTIMALSCIRNRHGEYEHMFNYSSVYNETIKKLIASQLTDGSFGNVYTTALVTQALIASGQEPNKQWNVTSTVQYFKKYFTSESMDFLSVYLALPLFSSRSLVDIGYVKCSDSYRKQERDISDVTDRLDEKMFIQYSLFIGDEGDIIHTIYLKIPRNSSAYDLMRVAQATDPKYKFLYRYTSDRMYVYQISDITNDPEAGKFWLLYTKDNENKTVHSHTKSPDKLILFDGEHLVMWYKTALI